MADGMIIKAVAPWFGGKRTLAQRIVAEFGQHRVYWELFGGSAAVLLNKPSCVMETFNDRHGDLVNLATVIRDPAMGARLYRRLRRTLMHEDVFEAAASELKRTPRSNRDHDYQGDMGNEDRAYAYFIVSWLGRNGVAGTSSYNSNFCVRYTANGGHAAKRWDSAIRSIPAWRERLRNVTILRRDAFELLPRIDDAKGTVIYLDPPYLVKGAKYLYDFNAEGNLLAPDDHDRLAAEASRFKKARVVISYYDHPTIRALYRGWTFVEAPTTKAMVMQGRRGEAGVDAVAPEVLIVNGPSYTESQ